MRPPRLSQRALGSFRNMATSRRSVGLEPTAAEPDGFDPAHPHAFYGCDYCLAAGDVEADGTALRIKGPSRFSIIGADVDCCPSCFENRVPLEERTKFVKLPEAKAIVVTEPLTAEFSLELNEFSLLELKPPPPPQPEFVVVLLLEDGPLKQQAETVIYELCLRFAFEPFPSHVTIASQFNSYEAADAAARAVATVFRSTDGSRVPLRVGPIAHEASASRCVTASVFPSQAFGDALVAAEAVKRDMKGGTSAAVHAMPHMPLAVVSGGQAVPAESERVAAINASKADALAGLDFAASAIAVWDVSKHLYATPAQWLKRSEAPV